MNLRFLFFSATLLNLWFIQSASAQVITTGENQQNDSMNLINLTVSSPDLYLAQSPIAITGVKIGKINNAVELFLETVASDKLQTVIKGENNSLIVDIPNARLQLKTEEKLVFLKPMEGIGEIRVLPQERNSIRVIIVGEKNRPQVELFDDDKALIFQIKSTVTNNQVSNSLAPQKIETPSISTTANNTTNNLAVNQTLPSPMTDKVENSPSVQINANTSEKESASDNETIELVVTATRSEENLRDVPRSVTVITNEQIQKYSGAGRNLSDILGKEVPGLGVGNNSNGEFFQTLRGRSPLILIDGIPQSTNRNVSRNLRTIDPSMVERVEILRGPTALYGDGATGGIINIITRKPTEDQVIYSLETGVTASLSHLEDSLGTSFKLGTSGKEGNVDYFVSAGIEKNSGFFDAEGDRIPPDLPSTQGSLADTTALSLFGKIGWNLGDHRLQFTVNHYNTQQNTEYASDPSVNAFPLQAQKARTRRGLELSTQPTTRTTQYTLEYQHPNLFWNSTVNAQLYYRDYFTRFSPFDGGTSIRTPEGYRIFQSQVDSEKYGGRISVNTPIVKDSLSLLTGVDYSQEDVVQNLLIFDRNEFVSSGGLRFRQIANIRPWTPPLTQTNLGLFAQLVWKPVDTLTIRSGLRHENVKLDINDFQTITGVNVAGGSLKYSPTLFNIGAVYKLTNNIDIFADFSQGFSVADVGVFLRQISRPGQSVNSINPEGQTLDNYEVGIRGNWNQLQASLSAFYNKSDWGTTIDQNTLTRVRAPERLYGVEATLDYQPSSKWKLGSTFSYVEGENDTNLDGIYKALNTQRISPIKVTAYLENETLPNWTNRLQLLYTGKRDRAFNEINDQGRRVDLVSIEPTFTLDLFSSLKLGRGTLSLGVLNLLNSQYFTPASQLLRNGRNETYTAAPGRALMLQYAIDF